MANEALALARQIGAPALIATGLSAVSLAVARTDPGQARARPCESRELSTALGYQSPSALLGGYDRVSRRRPGRHARTRRAHAPPGPNGRRGPDRRSRLPLFTSLRMPEPMPGDGTT